MKFNITAEKLQRWIEREEGCDIVAGILPEDEIVASPSQFEQLPAQDLLDKRVAIISNLSAAKK